MSNKHVDAAIRAITAGTQRHIQEIADLKFRLQHKQYDAHVERRTAELLQRMRRLCGLEPDPQLEESTNGDTAAA